MRTDFRHEIPTDAKVFIAGHRGMVGSAIWRRFEAEGYHNLVGRRSSDLDLRDRDATFDFFAQQKPDYLIDAAAKVGGIYGNDAAPADFLSDNLRMQVNLLDAAKEFGLTRALFLGSSCIYPTTAPLPISEDSFMTGPVEQTNFGYAIAKATGVFQVQALRQQYGCSFISAMPCNLYGFGDNFTIPGGHAFPMLMRRLHEAVQAGDDDFLIYGTGTTLREYLHADDVADASLFLLRRYDDGAPINIGAGSEIEINKLVAMMADVIGFEGSFSHDLSKPDGVKSKIMDSGRIRSLGWEPKIGLSDGIRLVYDWFLANQDSYRR
ncbi:GDP-L-fucose synthase [Stackebrandtia endophytica]|uniref:GDP-L-fucose synthase n=1 Tax=Stackebrandtia endophytica TaxID=1496996 RepID=A0A543AX73_9ACTN|nr:GDP-L-fucose synthase [Stackebrandtia endophytica]TQL77174.1 GDP-L-fucose synthase [Stackebrandtia endophytica]